MIKPVTILSSFALLFFTAHTPSAPAQALSKEAYRELREIVQNRIYSVCPPAKSYYVTIGQSVTPIFAFLQAAAVPSAGNLPLTDAVQVEYALQIESLPQLQIDLFGRTFSAFGVEPDALKRRIYGHFDRFLPSAKRLGTNKLCIIDFLVTGKTMRAVKLLLTKYYRERFQFSPEIFTVALDNREDDQNQFADVDHSIYLTAFSELQAIMNTDDFTSLSPHDSYTPPAYGQLMANQPLPPHMDSPPRELRPAYLNFRRKLLSQMMMDPQIKYDRYDCGPKLEAKGKE